MAINDLNMNTVLIDSDIIPIWDGMNGRTRSVYASTLKTYTSGNAYTSIKFEGNNLMGYTEENGWQIIGTIPPAKLALSGGGLPAPVEVTGINFSEEFEVTIDQLTGELSLKQQTPTIKVDGYPVSEIYTEGSINTRLENDSATFSVNNSVTLWTIHQVGIGDSPYVIDNPDQLGIEYQYGASSQFTQSMHLNTVGLPEGAQVKVTVVNVETDSKPIYVTQFRQGDDFTWPVSTPTVFTLRSGEWRVEESSQLIHVQNSTTFSGDAARKKIVHGVAVDPDSSITMDVTEEGVLIVGGGVNVDLTDYAKKNETNTFTADQTFNRDITVYGKGNFDDQVNTKIVNGSGVLNLKINNESPAINIGNAAIQHNKVSLFNFPAYLYEDSEYWGNTSGANSLINRAALDSAIEDALDSYDKKWEQLGEYVVSTNGNRPTGEAQQSGTLYIWHLTIASSTTSPNNEFKVRDIDAYDQFSATSEPFVLKIQQGDKAQYWKVNDAGWTTNNSTWHMSCNDVSGDDIVANQPVTLFMQVEDGESTYIYDGEGFGVPGKVTTGAGTVVQREITANYLSNPQQSGDLTIKLLTETGLKNWRFYYQFPANAALNTRKLYVRVDNRAATSKNIRHDETWQCEIKHNEDGEYDDFFWSKLADSASTFEAIDVSGFDIDEPKVKPLLKRFTNTDLIEIPLTLPEGFTVVVRQVIVRRSSGVESEMGFTYRHDSNTLKIHLNEVGSGLILTGIIKDEI